MARLSRAAFAGAFAFSAAGTAQADTWNVTGWAFEPSPMISRIEHVPSGLALDVYTGRLKLSAQNAQTSATAEFLTFCVDMFHPLQPGPFAVTSMNTLMSDPGKQDQLLALMWRANALIATAPNQSLASAAMQLAVWEVVNETDATYSFSGGSFRSYGWDTDGARGLAQSWLDNVTTGAWTAGANGHLTLLWSGVSQSQLLSAVPEPATWATMIAGFALAGSMARRRRMVLA